MIGGAPEDLEFGALNGQPHLFTVTGQCSSASAWFPGSSLRRNRVFAFDPFNLTVTAEGAVGTGCAALALDLVEPQSAAALPASLYVLITECDPQHTDDSAWRKGVAVFEAQGSQLKPTGVHYPATATAPDGDGDALPSPNSLAATRRGEVYVSNFQGWCPSCGARTPKIGASVAPDSVTDNIVLWRPMQSGGDSTGLGGEVRGRWEVVASDVGGANGLLLSRDPGQRYLYASAYHAGKVWRFTRDAQGRLTEPTLIIDPDDARTRKTLGGKLHPDNLSLGPDGELIVTGQRNLFLAGLHVALWRGIPARSQIVRVDLGPAEGCGQDGDCTPAGRILESLPLPAPFSGVSEAQRVGDRYYLGHIVLDRLGILTTSGAIPEDFSPAAGSLCDTAAAQGGAAYGERTGAQSVR